MKRLGDSSGGDTRPSKHDSRIDRPPEELEGLANRSSDHEQNWAKDNEKIQIAKEVTVIKKDIFGYDVEEVELQDIPTDVTEGMFERFMEDTALDIEKTKVKNMLEQILDQDLTEMSDFLIEISKLLVASDFNVELIKNMLLSTESEKCLTLLIKQPEILNNEKITPELWEQIFLSNKSYALLLILVMHPELFKYALLTAELLDEILFLSHPEYLLGLLVQHADLLRHKKITTELVAEIITSFQPGQILEFLSEDAWLLDNDKITKQILSRILFTGDPIEVINALKKYPALLDNHQITPEIWEQILLSNYAEDILHSLGESQALLENDKITAEFLAQYVDLYEKLNGEEGENFESVLFPYLLKRIDQSVSQSSGPFINLNRLLKDPDATKWNILPIREQNIDNDEWKILRENLELKMLKLFPGDEHKQKLANSLRWFDTIPKTRDARAGLQIVRQRVASIIDFINKQEIDPNILGSDAIVEEGVEIAKSLFNIISEGGRSCADRAALALEEAEMYAKSFTKKEGSTRGYAVNIAVNEFKRNIIPAKFLDKNNLEEDQIETILHHMLVLNEPFGLELSTKRMKYVAETQKPLSEAMNLVYEAVNEEDLIGFVQDHPLIQSHFRGDEKALEEFQQLMNDPTTGLGLAHWDISQDTSLDLEENLEEYIKKIRYLMAQAPSIKALSLLKLRFEADYYTGIRDNLYRTNPEAAKELDAIFNQFERMITNFKREKTILLLQEAGFLSDTPNYGDIDPSYWEQ